MHGSKESSASLEEEASHADHVHQATSIHTRRKILSNSRPIEYDIRSESIISETGQSTIASGLVCIRSRLFRSTRECRLLGLVHDFIEIQNGIRARQINAGQLAAAYDCIIVGGGQSGVVIGSRLSETTSHTQLATMVSQPRIGNRVGAVYAASVIGGGSAVNGMLVDRGSADDYNVWEKFRNPGWRWDGLLPYFRATKVTPSRADLAADYNNIDAAYGNGPIQITFPDWQWPGVKIQFKAWSEVGVPINYEGAAGNAYGAYWVPSNVDQQYHRSYARNTYFDPIISCQNLKVFTGCRVNEILFDTNKRAQGVKIQARGTANGGATITVKAAQEVVLSCSGVGWAFAAGGDQCFSGSTGRWRKFTGSSIIWYCVLITSLVLEKPLSRGTVPLNPTDKYAEATIDYNTNINLSDSEVMVAMLKFYRKWMAAPSMQQLTPVKDSKATRGQVSMGSSTAHSCCTTAMAPQEFAGVVSSNLMVYGVTGLCVGDISIIPIIPSAHSCATHQSPLRPNHPSAGNDSVTTTSLTTSSTTSFPGGPISTTTTMRAPQPTAASRNTANAGASVAARRTMDARSVLWD
ncbi:GMC oxidoreductase [Sphaerobolus stellatus SS14]|uniref:GMC oxidoreductase n=1 Tax=Sphaerobolus stellatus (strain SS14) TaxID=990650 RepID=A0A0C9VCN9_SPHS4|nr:GMC oxidoreductase [Sphaerobolus stellatus SS14]